MFNLIFIVSAYFHMIIYNAIFHIIQHKCVVVNPLEKCAIGCCSICFYGHLLLFMLIRSIRIIG